MNEKNIRLRKVIKITRFIIFIFLIILSAYTIKKRISPFQTDEEKQVKQIYKAAMKGVSGFRLRHVWIDEDNNSVEFTLKQKDYAGSNDFTEKELESIYKALKQLEENLNDNQEFENLYTKYYLVFQLGNTPKDLLCQVKYINNKATLYYCDNRTANYITDYYMMKGVRSISMAGKFVTVFEEENVDKLAELDTLEEIYFSSGRDIEIVEEFATLMKDIKPDCKIYHDSEEVVITD